MTSVYVHDIMGRPIYKEAITMPEAPSKKRWDAENSVVYTVKFMRRTDQDVIDFLQGKNRRNTILEVVRYYMEHHKEEQN